jgi:hypothetical protein
MPDDNDPSADQSAYSSRSDSFNSQLEASGSSMPNVVLPPASLANEQERTNMQTPRTFVPTSVLHATSLSANGAAADTASRRIIGGQVMQSSNGMSADTYQKSFPLMRPTGGPGSGVL